MNSTPSYGVHRIMGAETEYGVIAPSAPGTNPTVLSALVVNTYAKLAFRRGAAFREQLQRRALAAELTAEQARQAENYSTATPEGQWLGESESPLRDAFGQVQDASTAHSSQMTHTRTELTSEDIALEIMREAARLLRPGGYYAIHEMSLVPDYLRPELKEEIQKDLARTIRVNARPLTVAEWTALAEEAGFEVLDVYQTDMALLEPKRLLADEGPAGVAKIAFNLARKPQIRERVLGMRGVFRRHADHIGAIGLILRKK